MKAIILAAGKGSRIKSLAAGLPKCRINFFSKELIQWQMEALRDAGIKDIGIVTGYKADTFTEDLTYFNNKDWDNTQMVYSLMQAKDWLLSDDCIISYADICYSSNPIKQLISSESNFSIIYDPDWYKLWKIRMENPIEDAETFIINEQSFVSEIGKKPNTYQEVQGQYMGLINTTPESFKRILNYYSSLSEEKQKTIDFTSLLSGLIDTDIKLKAIPIQDQWYEFDTESDYNAYVNWRDITVDPFKKI